MRIPTLILPTLLALLLAPVARAEGEGELNVNEGNPEVVKAVRAVLAAKKEGEREEAKKRLLARSDLDPASFEAGLRGGPYHQKPMVTEIGERHSGRHLGLQWRGRDGKDRGFSLFVPKDYDPKVRIPVIFYLHHNSFSQGRGNVFASTALFKFRDLCDDYNVLFVAPYTGAGAEWWTEEGRRLVEWTLAEVKERYSIDENRVGLLGALDGADAVWYMGQEMPGTWSVLMPMTGDAYEIGAMIRPLYLGTLDRMDILMGVPGKSRGNLGDRDVNNYLDSLRPMFEQNMRITTAIYTEAQGDFHYLEKVKDLVASFVIDRKRNALPDEVDIETDREDGLRCLWLQSHGREEGGPIAGNFKSTLLRWKAPKIEEPKKRLGLGLEGRDKWEIGMIVTSVDIGARDAGVITGDVLLEVDGKAIRKVEDVAGCVEGHAWGSEAHVLVAREVRVSRLEIARRNQARYMKIRAKVEQLRAEGKAIPANLNDLAEEDEVPEDAENAEEDGCGEEEGCGCSIIQISEPGDGCGGDDKPGRKKPGAAKNEKTEMFVFERWVKIIRSEGKMVRADFGATWDPNYLESGVRAVQVIPGGHAHRSGFKEGDVIIQVGASKVERVRDLQAFFESYKFEEEPETERRVEFTVRRGAHGGSASEETVRVRWDAPTPHRVDARWDKKENILNVLTREVSSFTVYFARDLIAPETEFHVYVNGVPWQDIVDAANTPEYPRVERGSDPLVGDELHRMRQKRARVEGWKPDYAWAIDEAIALRDRELPFLARRTFDLKGRSDALRKSHGREEGHGARKGEKIKNAYEAYRSKE